MRFAGNTVRIRPVFMSAVAISGQICKVVKERDERHVLMPLPVREKKKKD